MWGLGQRLFFLHDGRTADLVQAIKSHYFATNSYCTQTSSAQLFYVLTTSSVYEPEASTDVCNSEANAVINNHNPLNSSQRPDLRNLLPSL